MLLTLYALRCLKIMPSILTARVHIMQNFGPRGECHDIINQRQYCAYPLNLKFALFCLLPCTHRLILQQTLWEYIRNSAAESLCKAKYSFFIS